MQKHRPLYGQRYIQSIVSVQFVETAYKVRQLTCALAAVKIFLRFVEIHVRCRWQKHCRVRVLRQSQIKAVALVIRYPAAVRLYGIVCEHKMIVRRRITKTARQ